MRQNRYDLPNLGNLTAFEAVVRKGNYTDAGAELNVTKGAISQRMKALETEMGLPLLEREKQGIRANENGNRLFSALQQGFSMLADEIDRIRRSGHPD